MKLQDALNISKRWGDKPCDHPSIEREISMGFSTGDYVCTQCGREVDEREWSKKNRDQRHSEKAK